MSVEIHATPLISPFTSELDEFKITGLPAFSVFRVELTLVHRTKFLAYAFFVSDKTGSIDLSKNAPLFGFYKGIDKMGLFTALYQDPTERFGSKLNLTPVPDALTYKISVHVLEEPKALAELEITRIVRPESVVREELHHETLEGVVFHPKELGFLSCAVLDKLGEKTPCILDLSGVGGAKEHRACFLAEQGYYVLALALYGKSEKLPRRHEDVNSEYIVEAINYITSLPFTPSKVVVIGTSLGGTWAFHAATRSPKVKAAISINGQAAYYFVSQIKENGKTLPWVQLSPAAMSQIEFENGCVSYAKMYGACKAEEKHLIPLENLEDHQQLFYIASEYDKAIPSVQQGNWIAERLKTVGKETQLKLEVAKKGCHMIDPPFVPITDVTFVAGKFLLFGGDAYVSGCEQRRLWPEVLHFIAENVKDL